MTLTHKPARAVRRFAERLRLVLYPTVQVRFEGRDVPIHLSEVIEAGIKRIRGRMRRAANREVRRAIGRAA